MNIDYLYSIVNLYLKREKDRRKANLNIQKNDQVMQFNFTMNENSLEKTSFSLPLDIVSSELINVLKTYKQDLMIIDEKYDNKDNNCHYSLVFKNGRILSFDGFSLLEVNGIRNALFDITINSNEIRLNELNEEKKMAYKPALSFQQAGFASITTLFLVGLFLTDVFVIALWIFKVLTK